jgi:hypothetical protein
MVWDAVSGRELLSLKGRIEPGLSVTVTPDGRRFVTGNGDGTASVWDAISGRELLTLKGHTGPVWSVTVTADGQRIITGSGDGTVKIWEAAAPDQVDLWNRQDQEAARRQAIWQRPGAVAPGFIQDWLIVAPFPLEPGQNRAEALEQEQLPGEARLQPRAGQHETVREGEYIWRAHRQKGPLLDFNRFLGKMTENCVAYAVCYVISDTERHDLLLQVGSDNEAKVYLNGQQVYKYTGERGLIALDPASPITLRRGTNVVVFKVVNGLWAWLGCLRFIDPEGNPAKGLRVSLTPG